jgi:hypothetical protein
MLRRNTNATFLVERNVGYDRLIRGNALPRGWKTSRQCICRSAQRAKVPIKPASQPFWVLHPNAPRVRIRVWAALHVLPGKIYLSVRRHDAVDALLAGNADASLGDREARGRRLGLRGRSRCRIGSGIVEREGDRSLMVACEGVLHVQLLNAYAIWGGKVCFAIAFTGPVQLICGVDDGPLSFLPYRTLFPARYR